jgi:hypothetical protein
MYSSMTTWKIAGYALFVFAVFGMGLAALLVSSALTTGGGFVGEGVFFQSLFASLAAASGIASAAAAAAGLALVRMRHAPSRASLATVARGILRAVSACLVVSLGLAVACEALLAFMPPVDEGATVIGLPGLPHVGRSPMTRVVTSTAYWGLILAAAYGIARLVLRTRSPVVCGLAAISMALLAHILLSPFVLPILLLFFLSK